MRARHALLVALSAALPVALLAACSEPPPTLVYQAIPVERRDIVVSAEAAGTIEPNVTVEVKSKASGEILEMRVETGDLVTQGTLMVRIDQRQPRNLLAEAEAELDVALAGLANATSQKRRAEELFKAESISETEYDAAGRLLFVFGVTGAGAGEFFLPTGIAIGPDNRIYVADSYNRRVQIFRYQPGTTAAPGGN